MKKPTYLFCIWQVGFFPSIFFFQKSKRRSEFLQFMTLHYLRDLTPENDIIDTIKAVLD